MTALTKRVQRLKARFGPPEDPEGRRLIELLNARPRRVAEANGETYVPSQPEDVSGMSIIEIPRMGYKRNDAGEHPQTK
jgi:hypothetical protein